MKILISGSSGFIGTKLKSYLTEKGYEVYSLKRSRTNLLDNEIYWDPKNKAIEDTNLENFDVFINLAGVRIAGFRWTKYKKEAIIESRVDSTLFLRQIIEKLKTPPKVFVSVSAVGFYGNRGEEVLTEDSPIGGGFLAYVCKLWESSSKTTKTRVVNPRLGVVLDASGGVLGLMLRIFRLGLGGVLGSGEQYFSWISLNDLVRALEFVVLNEEISGPVNFTAPNSITNKELTKRISEKLKRPAFFHIPAILIKFILGQMGNELFLYSQRVEPVKLRQASFVFRDKQIEDCI